MALNVKRRKKKNIIKSIGNRLRLSVYRSNQNLSAQFIDDEKGATVTSISTLKEPGTVNIKLAEKIGAELAKNAIDKSIETVIFDRGNYQYKGIIKAFAESARKAGLKF